MTTKTASEGEVRGRVLVAVPDASAADELFELGVHLAARRQHALLALVRDAMELAVAGALPFVYEVDRCTGSLRPFDSAAAARAIARLARDCERRLAELAAARRVRAAVARVSGGLTDAALAARSADDLLLLGTAGGPARRRVGRHPASRRVGVLTGGNDDDLAALAVAAELVEGASERAAGHAPMRIPAPSSLALAAPLAAVDILVLSWRRAEADPVGLQRLLEVARDMMVIVVPSLARSGHALP
jgi:hypothetical protein